MAKKGLRLKAPPQIDAALDKVDTVICAKLPPNIRFITNSTKGR